MLSKLTVVTPRRIADRMGYFSAVGILPHQPTILMQWRPYSGPNSAIATPIFQPKTSE